MKFNWRQSNALLLSWYVMHSQFMRYAIIGFGSNAVLYALYLLITTIGVGHKTAMTLLYMTGTLQTFLLNRQWTFGHKGNIRNAFIRYVVIYFLGYLVNLCCLYIFVDVLGHAHQLVQGIMIILVAVLLFMLQRLWVFGKQSEKPGYMPKQGIP